MIGTMLGPYRILEKLGEGGMGQVYKARDTRLDRSVAIKVLLAGISVDQDRRARFEREAKTIAGLNHPHICTLFDIGHDVPAREAGSGGLEPHGSAVDYLVMELLAGETLAERLARGRLPPEQAFTVATEIADALAAAHRQGIVHRDLKPANVMLTKSGAKLLDFGLAKLKGHGEQAAADHPASAPTGPASLTAEGVIVGTLPYMAPEQVEGRPADARTDLWALGLLLYEMLTGRRAFEGGSAASLIAAILEHDPPPLSAAQPLTPPALERLVRRCLAKEPDARWQSASDVAEELRWIREAGDTALVKAAPARRRWVLVVATVAAAAFLLGVAAKWAVDRLSGPTATEVTRTTIGVPSGVDLYSGLPSLALSPDGRRIAYIAVGADGVTRLYVRSVHELTATPVPGTEGALHPVFSPDGTEVAFATADKLHTVRLGGGAPVALCELTEAMRGASWGDGGVIVFTPSSAGGLWRVAESGGAPQKVAEPDAARGEKTIRWPDVLPGGKAVLVTVAKSDALSYDDGSIEVVSLDTGKRRMLLEGGTCARYSPSGHIVYLQGQSLFAVAFDLRTLSVSGPRVPVVSGVLSQSAMRGFAAFSISRAGSLLYAIGGVWKPRNQLVAVDRDGRQRAFSEERRAFNTVRLSPDGAKTVSGVTSATDQVWVCDAARGRCARVTGDWDNIRPVWGPGMDSVTLASNRTGRHFQLYSQPADGSGAPERLVTSTSDDLPGSWSADGRVLAFSRRSPETSWDIWLMRDGQPLEFLATRFIELAPRISPDGEWLAYESDESGQPEVYVRSLRGRGGVVQVSADGGTEPLWAPGGSELYYLTGADVMAVEVATRPEFAVRASRPLFKTPNWADQRGTYPMRAHFDVMRDGRSFVVLVPDQSQTSIGGELILVQNWFHELKALVPPGR